MEVIHLNNSIKITDPLVVTIGQFDGLDTFEWLDGLKRRLDIKEHRRIIEFDSNPYFSGRNLIGSLFTAISNKQVIALKYHTFKNPEIKEVVVYPYLFRIRCILLCLKSDTRIL